MPDIKLLPTQLGTDIRYLAMTDSVSGDILAMNVDHIVAMIIEAGSPSDVTLVFDVTIPGQGNQTQVLTATATGAEADALKSWWASQLRGSVTVTINS